MGEGLNDPKRQVWKEPDQTEEAELPQLSLDYREYNQLQTPQQFIQLLRARIPQTTDPAQKMVLETTLSGLQTSIQDYNKFATSQEPNLRAVALSIPAFQNHIVQSFNIDHSLAFYFASSLVHNSEAHIAPLPANTAPPNPQVQPEVVAQPQAKVEAKPALPDFSQCQSVPELMTLIQQTAQRNGDPQLSLAHQEISRVIAGIVEYKKQNPNWTPLPPSQISDMFRSLNIQRWPNYNFLIPIYARLASHAMSVQHYARTQPQPGDDGRVKVEGFVTTKPNVQELEAQLSRMQTLMRQREWEVANLPSRARTPEEDEKFRKQYNEWLRQEKELKRQIGEAKRQNHRN